MLMTHFNNFPPIRILCALFNDLTSVVSSVQSFSGHLFAEVSLRLYIYLVVITRLAKKDYLHFSTEHKQWNNLLLAVNELKKHP